MTGYRLTPRAREGLRGILTYVEERFGPRVATRVLDRIACALEQLASSPRLGHCRADLTSDETVRFWPVGPTLISYRLTAEQLEVLFIERGERNWFELLRALDE